MSLSPEGAKAAEEAVERILAEVTQAAA